MKRRCYADVLNNYLRAGNEKCSPQVLFELAHSEVDRIRLRVAENPSAPQEVLEVLAADKNPDVRIAVGTNSSTPLHIKCRFAFDPDPNVRLGLAMEMGTPIELLDKLIDDSNPYVSCAAQKTKELLGTTNSNSFGYHRFFKWVKKGGRSSEPQYA